MAFKWAHEADPEAILYYNDYSIEQDAADNSGKHPSSLLLLKRLLDEGAPIHGVGIQGHWHLDTRIDNIEKAIENYKKLGLEIAITELDVTTRGFNSGAFNPGPGAMAPSAQNPTFSFAAFEGGGAGARRGRGTGGGFGRRGGGTPPSPEVLAAMFEQQAEIYKKMFEIFKRNSDVVKRVTFWGISDTRTWRRGQNPLLFDGEMNPKPAYQAILDVAKD
jgi:endo-1,4-beta-xylanase